MRTKGVNRDLADSLADSIRSSTYLRDLIEFSRAVHAEMDALITAARNGGNGIQDCVLFTTTYPCHNCARHIVAAGICAVYFIEPYGKSLTDELHSDAIDHNAESPPDQADGREKRVAFLHFEGVSPNRFASLFSHFDSRKDSSGRVTPFIPATAEQKVPELLDNYRELEGNVVERLLKRKAAIAAANNPGGGAA
ncbi:deaminase [Lysobacter antibioticus]|uniref:deaminase n=1 Tax=Lysobacter antibioticus TaxID=84531 RepID=UPI0009A13C42